MRDRRTLVAALAQLKSGADPKIEAVAQVNFDCWVALSYPLLVRRASAAGMPFMQPCSRSRHRISRKEIPS